MQNKNVLLISIVAVVVLLAAGIAVYFFRQSDDNAPARNDKKTMAYNFQGEVLGKDDSELLARGAVLLLSNNKPQLMEQVIKFKISPDIRISKLEGDGANARQIDADLSMIEAGDRIMLKADGLSVAGSEATAVDILILGDKK